MKVIEDRRPEAGFTYPFLLTCGYCKSLLQVEQGDVHQNKTEGQLGPHFYSEIKCPLCEKASAVFPGRREGTPV
jgi:hypothetical protein